MRWSSTFLLLALLPLPAAAVQVTDWPLPAPPASAQPNLAVGRDGSLLLSWVERRGDGHRLRFARHRGGDAANGWDAPRTVAEGDHWFVNWADFPALVELPGGTLWAHMLVRNGTSTYAYDTRLFQSTDGGATWTPRGPAHDDGTPTEHGFATLWPAADATLGIAWLYGRHTGGGGHGHDHHGGGGAMTLRAARFGDDGRKQADESLDASTCDCCQTDSAVDGDATLLVWRDRAPGEVRDIVVARHDAAGWQAPVAVHADGWVMPACPVNGPAIAARDGQAWVAWYTAAAGTPELRLARSADGGRRFDGMRVLAAGDAQQGRLDLAADASGVWTSWLQEDGDGQSLWLARHDPRLEREHFRLRVATVEGRGRATGFPRLQLRDGTAWLAWTEVVDGRPRLRGVAVRP